METTQYSPEPARAEFIDRHEEISSNAIIVAECLFDPSLFDREDLTSRQSDALHGASLFPDPYTPDSALLRFLSDTAFAHL